MLCEFVQFLNVWFALTVDAIVDATGVRSAIFFVVVILSDILCLGPLFRILVGSSFSYWLTGTLP